jgi:hypothetical protein
MYSDLLGILTQTVSSLLAQLQLIGNIHLPRTPLNKPFR